MQPKNLLFIMSDQHGPAFMGVNGHPLVKTPNLDRLAARGTLFEHAYTNCPICVPARASFATGRYVHDCGYWDNADPYDGAVKGWGHRLMAQGHTVVSIGKLHYRNDTDPTGFSEQIIPLHVVDGLGDLIGLVRDPLPERKAAAKYARDTGRGESTYTGYDRNITAAAVRWLTDEAPRHKDKPWVLFVSFVCPHFPLIAPPEFYDLYPEDEMPVPPLYDEVGRPTHAYYAAMRHCINYDKYFDEASIRRAIAGYLGLCSFVDANVGKLLAALESAGLVDDTRIVYTSDHGEALGKRGLWGKSTMFEESAAIPLLMAGPDVPAGRRIATLTSLVDCAPTIMDAVGATRAPEDATLPGRSLFDIIAGAEPGRVAFSEYHAAASPTATFMLREGRYKLVYFVGMAAQLFDLETDPDETRDLATLPEHAEVLNRLEARLREICDPEDVDRRAKADQAATIARHGGVEAILSRGDFGYSPAPGQKPEFAS
ncbi:MAG: sulfatase-like hydrolase/transferase [Hyphomicrobiaceae bacterium]